MNITYEYSKEHKGSYKLWQTKGGKWQWEASGNNGEADSIAEAMKQAREWIVDGYDRLQPNLKTLKASTKEID